MHSDPASDAHPCVGRVGSPSAAHDERELRVAVAGEGDVGEPHPRVDRRTDMLNRRNLLQLVALAGAGALAPIALGGCSASGGVKPSALGLAMSDVEESGGLADALPKAVAALGSLTGQLLGRLGQPPGNLVFSPYSVQVALAMTACGARGRTAQEMLRVLGVGGVDQLGGGLAALSRHLGGLAGEKQRADGSSARLTVDTANGLFGQRDTAWEQGFLDVLARDFASGMQIVDYRTAPEQACSLINAWTAGRTHHRIEEIVPAGSLDALTRLVLVNALYLSAPWETPFEKSATRPGPFRRADGSTVQAKLMAGLLEDASYAATADWQSVRLPYAGRDLAMTVVLPRAGAMARTWDVVVNGGIAKLLAAPQPQAVQLTLPKWRLRTQVPLEDALSALGMPTAFDSTHADFSGMTRQVPPHISAVLHETFIAVDEEGTEAAAATAVLVGTLAAPVAVPMTVDRPYLYVIHDVTHGTPLLVGRVDDPTR
jgi:serpin B